MNKPSYPDPDWAWPRPGAVICERCGDDDTGPWIPLDDGSFLCEACWEKRTT